MPFDAEVSTWRLAASQHGAFSRSQALKAGLSAPTVAYRFRSGRWDQLRPGVYRVAGTPGSWKQEVMAALLWAGPGAAVSHSTAARLWNLEGLPRRHRDEPVHVSVPPPRHPAAPDVVVHRPRELGERDCTDLDGIHVTNLPRTLIDLAAEPGSVKLELLLESALSYRQFDLPWLRKTLRRLGARGREGVGGLLRLADERTGERPDHDSELERQMHAFFLRWRLPVPASHYNLFDADRWYGELDFAYPKQRVAILTHGFWIHRRRTNWERDQAQLGDLAALGWRAVPVTREQLETDEKTVRDRIRRALARAK